MNIIRKKCMLITPCNVTFKLSNGRELRPNTKSVEFVWTGEIRTALNSGIRVFEIGADGKQVQINKSNFDKINVDMNYSEEEVVEGKKEEVAVEEAPKTEEVKEEEPVEDPADSESPSEDEPEEEAELTDEPQEDPEAKYYQDKSEDDCDEDKEDSEDDEYNVD